MSKQFCGGSRKERTPLSRTFPPCPCEKCKLRRACGVLDRQQQRHAAQKCMGDCRAARRDFSAFVGEMCSIVAFFVIATAMFWLAVSQHVFVAAVKLHRSDRHVKMTALVLASLLLLSVVFKVVRHKVQLKCQARARSRARQEALQKHEKAIGCMNLGKPSAKNSKAAQRLAGGGGGGGGDGDSYRRWGRRARSSAAASATSTDPRARAVFKQSKLYAIPAEMKQPPGFLVYLREAILRHAPLV